MSAPFTTSLLVKFRSVNSQFGVTRATVQALANEMDTTETQVIHMALSRLASDVLPAYEADDGPLTAVQLGAVKRRAKKLLPSGEVLSSQALF
nr:hypothetical protein [uncultured Albidiferax sp.]